MLNLQAGCAKGYPQREFSVGAYADSAGSAAALYDGIRQVIEPALVFYSIDILHGADSLFPVLYVLGQRYYTLS